MKISKRVDVPPDSKLSWGDSLRNHALGTTFYPDGDRHTIRVGEGCNALPRRRTYDLSFGKLFHHSCLSHSHSGTQQRTG
jgi:hypothetical protein